jgi:hypothetical protein
MRHWWAVELRSEVFKKVQNWPLEAEYWWRSETSYPGQIERESPDTSTAQQSIMVVEIESLGEASMSIPDQPWLSEGHV